MNLFSSSISAPKPLREPGAQSRVVRKMMDPQTGKTVRMFECQCGARSWIEAKE
jgi:hypothetical protein